MIKKKHLAIYGSIKLQRMYCKKCKDMALVVDNKLLCCNSDVGNKLQKGIEIIVNGEQRKRPGLAEQEKILKIQNNKCLYCNKPFGTMYVREGKNYVRYTQIHYDHLIPYSYCKQNKNNFVAACNICNSIKYNKMFNTVEEAFYYVEYNRKKKGYIYADEGKELSGVQQEVSV
jgi:5-methylcytosine-specific restriction endonuclease McrA